MGNTSPSLLEMTDRGARSDGKNAQLTKESPKTRVQKFACTQGSHRVNLARVVKGPSEEDDAFDARGGASGTRTGVDQVPGVSPRKQRPLNQEGKRLGKKNGSHHSERAMEGDTARLEPDITRNKGESRTLAQKNNRRPSREGVFQSHAKTGGEKGRRAG